MIVISSDTSDSEISKVSEPYIQRLRKVLAAEFSVCKNAQKTPPFLATLFTIRLWNGNHHFVASILQKKQSSGQAVSGTIPAKVGEEYGTTVEQGCDWGTEHLALILEDKIGK